MLNFIQKRRKKDEVEVEYAPTAPLPEQKRIAELSGCELRGARRGIGGQTPADRDAGSFEEEHRPAGCH